MGHAVANPEPIAAPKFELGALESHALKATLWTILSYGAGQCLRVVNSLLLTRLLMPSAFGEMSLVTTLIVGMALLSDIGLAPSVIQSKRGDEPEFLNTAWTLQSMRGVALWFVAIGLAWPAARFYHDHSLVYVLPVLALTSIITGFNSTGLLTLSRHMGVRRLFAVEFSTQIVALVSTVAFALWKPNVWALVAGTLISSVYRMVLSHHRKAVPGLRNRFHWHRASLHEIVHFGKWIFLGTAFYFFASQADRLILGAYVSLTVLGLYQIAFQISDIPRSVINAFSAKVGYPFIAKIVHLPRGEFREQYLRYRGYALLAGGSLLSVVVVWGNLVILKLYPARYAGASWMVPVLAVGLWHTLLYTTTSPVLLSLGKSTYNAVGNAAYGAAMFIGVPLAFHHWGLTGAVIAIAAGDFPLYVVTQFGATREGVRPLWQDLKLTGAFLGMLGLFYLVRRTL